MTQALLQLSCEGDWQLHRTDGDEKQTYPATVPGCAHTDLLEAGAIPDPWFSDNEKHVHWVCLADWAYTRTIQVDAELLERDHVDLVCEGLDTVAKLFINGKPLGQTDNMFDAWRFDAKAHLTPGPNELRIAFDSIIPMLREKDAQRRLPGWNFYHEDFRGKSYVRKMGCAFGWDWGLMAPTVGIWKPIYFQGYDTRILDVQITQQHDDAGTVTLEIDTEVSGDAQPIRATLGQNGQTVATQTARSDEPILIDIEEPNLWWPNGMGAQPLYDVHIELLDDGQAVIDQSHRRIGLRTIVLEQEPDQFGWSFRFVVNGRAVFSKGANWIPCDVFPSRISDQTYRHQLQSAATSGMNMIRLWGGGIYEDERFYDLCDELGLMIWHDFMFACSTYPTFDPDFMDNCHAEATDQIKRIRHRASLALWCGNNELEQGLVADQWTESAMSWDDYRPLFDQMLPNLVDALDGVTPYIPSSGHTPHQRNDHRSHTGGDTHAWDVWFGGQPFEAQRNWVFRFMSEFGFQSFPELRSVEQFTEPGDRQLTSWVMDYHQRSGPGNETIFKYLLQWFTPPRDLDAALQLTQLTQALCIEYAADHARRIHGRMDGLLYWQLNDLWPGATWSSIDVYGRWKALQYFAKRFFAPVRVSLLEEPADGTVRAYISNHLPDNTQVTLHWRVTNCAGDTLDEGSQAAAIASQACEEVLTINCQPHRERGGAAKLPWNVQQYPHCPMSGDRDVLVWAWVTDSDGQEISCTLATFARPKHLQLKSPKITHSISTEQDGQTRITLETDRPALWTRLFVLNQDGLFSDNFFHLIPGRPTVVHTRDFDATVADQLRTQSLVDLMGMPQKAED